MVYVALLRGINVGGSNKIGMPALKASLEASGLRNVSTYINSGNVIFEDTQHSKAELAALSQETIARCFSLEIMVQVRSLADFETMMATLPGDWRNDEKMKCDVLFLGDAIDNSRLLETLQTKLGMDTVLYVPGALLWSVAKKHLTRSGLLKLVGTETYRQMTVRNVNTVRAIFARMRGEHA